MARGSAQIGDKTLLDAIVPALDKIEQLSQNGRHDLEAAFHAASEVATAAIEGTRNWPAKRAVNPTPVTASIGTLDPGIVAVAMMLTAVANDFDQISRANKPRINSKNFHFNPPSQKPIPPQP